MVSYARYLLSRGTPIIDRPCRLIGYSEHMRKIISSTNGSENIEHAVQ